MLLSLSQCSITFPKMCPGIAQLKADINLSSPMMPAKRGSRIPGLPDRAETIETKENFVSRVARGNYGPKNPYHR